MVRSKISISILVFVFLAQIFTYNLNAQEGLQLSGHAVGGIGMISPQNHYGNPHYELDYKYKFSYGGNLKIGYGFKESIAVLLLAGYQQFDQKYVGNFRPGLGAPEQNHEKRIKLSYLDLGLLAKFATSFQGQYVYDVKAQLVVSTGFLFRKLIGADLKYIANGNQVSYPSILIPYQYPNYPYNSVGDADALFTKWNVSYILNIGADIFISEKLAVTPAIEGQIALLDINAKGYRQHPEYKASRTMFGGLSVGMTYYFSRE